MNKLKIGLLCRNSLNYSNSRIANEAVRAGHEIFPIDYVNCDLKISSDQCDIFYQGESLSVLDAIIPRISVETNFYGIAVVRQFEAMGIFTLNSSQGILNARDKLRTMQILAQNQLPFPNSIVSHNALNVESNIQSLGGAPVVVKLLEGMQGIGTVLAESEKSAYSVVETLLSLKTNIMLQEFIAESKGCDIRVFVLGNKIIATMERTAKEGDFRSNLHRGGTSQKIEISLSQEEMSKLAANKIGLNMAGVDLIRSKEKTMILEVNSCPGLEGIEKTSGVNIASDIIKFIEENYKKNESSI